MKYGNAPALPAGLPRIEDTRPSTYVILARVRVSINPVKNATRSVHSLSPEKTWPIHSTAEGGGPTPGIRPLGA